MDLQLIVAELKKERDRIDRAIAALDGTPATGTTTRTGRATATRRISVGRRGFRRGHLTAGGRKRLSELMKKRWAMRRRKAANGRKAPKVD